MTIRLARPDARSVTKSDAPPLVLPFRESKSWSDDMGLVYAEIELMSAEDLLAHRRGTLDEKDIKQVKVKTLVDSGAEMLIINEHIQAQLGLLQIETRSAQLADDKIVQLPVVGPVEVRFANRRTSVDALVLPGETEPLLGALPMEDMDVLIDPRNQRLIVNPANPYIVKKSLK